MALNIIAVILGFLASSIVNMGLVMIAPHFIPPPDGVNVNDAKSLAANMHLLAPRHFVFPFAAHALGTFAGALTAYLIASNRRAMFAYIIGALGLLGGIAACILIPAPAWFMVMDLTLAYLPMAWLATVIGRSLARTSKSAA